MRKTAIAFSPGLLKECRAAYDWWEKLATGRKGLGLMFGWAVAEATVWPLIPDFLLVPMAAVNRKKFYLSWLAAVCGSALGGTFMLLLATNFPAFAQNLLTHLPLVGAHQINIVKGELAAGGVSAFWKQPWSGVGFKVWAVQGGSAGLNLGQVIPIFILARAFRMAVFATIARVGGEALKNFLRDYSLFLGLIYLVLFFYGWWQITII